MTTRTRTAARVFTETLLQQPAQLMDLSEVARAADELYGLGLSIGPTKPKSKIPFLWKRLQYSRINPAFIRELFDNGAGLFVMTGSISRNLTILDCETRAEADRHAREFERRGLVPWVVQSGGAKGGRHFWWFTYGAPVANVPKAKFPGGQAELWGQKHYCLCPPSVHPGTGALYEWVKREGLEPPAIALSALDWLPVHFASERRRQPAARNPLFCLSRATQDFIANGAADRSRNTRLFSAACDLNGNEFSLREARDWLLQPAERSGLERREIETTIKSAYSKGRTPAKRREDKAPAPMPTWARAQAWADAHHWTRLTATATGRHRDAKTKSITYTVTASTARRVFLACCERARLDHAEIFRATTRELSELAGVKSDTAHRALQCLIAAGLLLRRGYSDLQAGLYAFGKAGVQNGDNRNTGSLNTVPILTPPHDAFSHGALGNTGEQIWRLVLREPKRRAEIECTLHLSRSTVKRRLAQLFLYGLVEKDSQHRWAGKPAGADHLQNVAAKQATLGRGENRKAKHARQRSEDVSKAILRYKRKWESRQR